MKKAIILIFILCFTNFTHAENEFTLDESTKNLCNQVMLSIYDDIKSKKDRHKELENFSERSLTKNKYGIYAIKYTHRDSNGSSTTLPYSFGLTIIGIDDQSYFKNETKDFNYGFPLLKLKFSGFQNRTLKSKQFDISKSIQKFGLVLWDQQQIFMPLKLVLEPVKEVYQVGEDIEFRVKLINVSRQFVKIKELNEKTLFFLYNNRVWGAKESNPKKTKDVKKITLKPGDFYSKQFIGNAFLIPKEFEIHGSYGMTFKGVKPYGSLKVKVVNNNILSE